MSIYYQDEHVTLYHGDAEDILPTLAAQTVITDPPYSVSKPKANGRGEMLGFVSPNWNEKATHSRGYADHHTETYMRLMNSVMALAVDCIPDSRHVVMFAGNRTLNEALNAATGAGLQLLDMLTFIYEQGVAKSTTTLAVAHELRTTNLIALIHDSLIGDAHYDDLIAETRTRLGLGGDS